MKKEVSMSEVKEEKKKRRSRKSGNGKVDKAILDNMNLLTERIGTVEKERSADKVLLDEIVTQFIDLKEKLNGAHAVVVVSEVHAGGVSLEEENMAQVEAMLGNTETQPGQEVEEHPEAMKPKRAWWVIPAIVLLLAIAGFIAFLVVTGRIE
jgi:hypothetical protein